MKNLKNLGKALNKQQQKAINGGFSATCNVFSCFNDQQCEVQCSDLIESAFEQPTFTCVFGRCVVTF